MYYCIECNYGCDSKCKWTRHVITEKHNKKIINNNVNIDKTINIENGVSNDLVMKLILQNDEMKNTMAEQNKLFLDKMNQNIIVSNNNISNCNNTNKFNLNFFLNEQCKDAMNMNDFINSIETTLEDAIATTRLGFVEGVTKQIEKLTANIGGIHKRPFHCTDEKRSTLMIKNNNEWTKDESTDKAELMRLVNKVENRNCMKIHEYQRDNPACYSLFTPEGELIGRMLSVLVGRENNDKEKIIRKIMKQITIEK
jgi:hypothetical protein